MRDSDNQSGHDLGIRFLESSKSNFNVYLRLKTATLEGNEGQWKTERLIGKRGSGKLSVKLINT